MHGDKKVVYVDKPLPPVSMTTEDKTSFRVKRGARIKLSASWHSKEKKASPKKEKKKTASSDKKPFPAPPLPPSGIDFTSLHFRFGPSVILKFWTNFN
jgi:hypothetical protein